MKYSDIIRYNAERHSSVEWWPSYAFHYTDLRNAIGILQTGYIYSRYDAIRNNRMINNNASNMVIDMTSNDVKNCVRFYFRPLTPTQYHNEGYKHPSIRFMGDSSANVPVPVFFLFDLETMLNMQDVAFTEKTLVGSGSEILTGVEAFSELNFDKIYSNGPMHDRENDVKYRHAEIISLKPFQIDSCLRYIMCRNNIEKITLLNILRREAPDAYRKYANIISVCKENMFENNGLFITDCRFKNGRTFIDFNKAPEKYDYVKRTTGSLQPIPARTEFSWVTNGNVIYRSQAQFMVDYLNTPSMTIMHNDKHPLDARTLYTSVYIDNILMCEVGQQLYDAAVI